MSRLYTFTITSLFFSFGALNIAQATEAQGSFNDNQIKLQDETRISPRNSDLAQSEIPVFEYEDFEFWSDECILLGQEEDYQKTIETCERAISIEEKEDNVDLWTNRSNALFFQGNYLEAIASYNRVLRVAPTSSVSMMYKCAALFQLNRYEDAIDTCENALEVNGNWGQESPAKAWYYRGLALQSVGRAETALNSLARAVILDPEDIFAKAGLCGLEVDLRLYHSPQLRQNRSQLRQDTIDIIGAENFTKLFSQFSAARNPSDEAKQVICSLDLAAEIYEQALAQNPDNATLWMEQGLILEQLGRFEQALTSYEQATLHLPDYAIALAHHCAMSVHTKQYEKALESCEAALQGNHNWGRWGKHIGSAYGWTQKSAALIGLGQYEDALAASERAIAIAPQYPAAWNNKAISHWYLNALDEQAKVSIDRAIAEHEQAKVNYTDRPNVQNETFQLEQYETPIFFYRSQITALFNKGRINTSHNDFLVAIDTYSEAIKLHEDQKVIWDFPIIDSQLLANIHLSQATAYIAKNSANQCGEITQIDKDKMLESAIKAKDLRPQDFMNWYTLGLAQLYNCKDYLAAENYFTEALTRSPNNIYALTGLGIALARMQDIEQAINIFEQASNIDPTYLLPKACRELLVVQLGSVVEGENTQDPNNQCSFWL